MMPARRLTHVTSPFWAPVAVGILAGLMLWSTGLGAAFGAEMNDGTNTDGENSVMFVKKDDYGLNTHLYLVADMERSLEFYVAAFGLSAENILRDDKGAAFHAELQANGETVLMIGPEGSPDSPHGMSPNSGGYKPSFNAYLYVGDVDAFAARAADAGAEMVEEPADQFWGDRTAAFKDPDGYLWFIATKIEGEGEGE